MARVHPTDAPNLYGIWQVDGFSAEGYRRDPLLTDELRWRRVIFDRPFLMSDPVMVTVQHMDDSFEVFGGTIDPAKHFIDLGNRIELGTFQETPTRTRLTYWWPEPGTDRIVIDGEDFAGHRIHAWFTQSIRARSHSSNAASTWYRSSRTTGEATNCGL